MNEAAARARAEKVLRELELNPDIVIGECIERPRSWICLVVSASGEPLLGNVPFVVRKSEGSVFTLGIRLANRELGPDPSLLDRLLRWLDRRRLRY